MKQPRTEQLIAALLMASFVLAGLSVVYGSVTDKENAKKRALVILGDAHHSVFPQYAALVRPLQKKGYDTHVILDYDVPFAALSEYDMIVLSRYAYDDVKLCQHHNFNFAKGKDNLWLTSQQEQAFEEYVTAGGRLFLHHDGIGFYPKDRAISRLAKAHFITHPPVGTIAITATGKLPKLTRDLERFEVEDEDYVVEMDE
jgi:hypothetical protein